LNHFLNKISLEKKKYISIFNNKNKINLEPKERRRIKKESKEGHHNHQKKGR